jgi:nucleotide-binding universal stress UspA family protein
MSRVKRLLVPTDFSPTSDIAFKYALDMAARDGASIHLLHVVEDSHSGAPYPDGFYIELPALREQMIAEAQKRLDEANDACGTVNVPVTTQVVVGRPAVSITEEANTRGSDLIVMGTHGRSGFAHLMLGSVAERVLRTAQCPVLIVRDSSRAADIIAAESVTKRLSAGV